MVRPGASFLALSLLLRFEKKGIADKQLLSRAVVASSIEHAKAVEAGMWVRKVLLEWSWIYNASKIGT